MTRSNTCKVCVKESAKLHYEERKKYQQAYRGKSVGGSRDILFGGGGI